MKSYPPLNGEPTDTDRLVIAKFKAEALEYAKRPPDPNELPF
ncbi:MAG: hypothetical protein SFX18_14335 [Pirellulales bacterium]|nr:hypothetical protein [Pirellulales bacterium]